MKTVKEYSDDLAPEYQNIIKLVLAPLEKHNASINVMMFKIGSKFYGYKPIKAYTEMPNHNITKERQEEFALEFAKIGVEFSKQDLEVIFCIMGLKEGGELMFVPETSLFHNINVMETAKQMMN